MESLEVPMASLDTVLSEGGVCILDDFNQVISDALDNIADTCAFVDAEGQPADCEDLGSGPAVKILWFGDILETLIHNGKFVGEEVVGKFRVEMPVQK
jgi:hypothetical protein